MLGGLLLGGRLLAPSATRRPRLATAMGVLAYLGVGLVYAVYRLAMLHLYTPVQAPLIWPRLAGADLGCAAGAWPCVLGD